MQLKVDTRERNEELYDTLFELCEQSGHTMVDENQVVGDYNWYQDDGSHTGCVVEFKEMDTQDFFRSLQSGHLDTQLLDMEQYPHAFLIVGGKFNPKDYRGRLTRKQFIAKLSSIGVRTTVKPLWFERITDAAQFIAEIPNQLNKGEKVDIIATRHSKTRNRHDYNLNQFLALPTIGAKRGTELKEEYKTFYNFLSHAQKGEVPDLPKGAREYVASITGIDVNLLIPEVERWTAIPGIGKSTAEKYIEQGLTIDQFISRVDGGIIKVGLQTNRWVEDEIRKRNRSKK